MNLSDYQKTLLREGANQGQEGMYRIASVILNRAKALRMTPDQVVNIPDQFAGRWEPDLDKFVANTPQQTIADANMAWQRASQKPFNNSLYFVTKKAYENPEHASWMNNLDVTDQYGDHVFMAPKPGMPHGLRRR